MRIGAGPAVLLVASTACSNAAPHDPCNPIDPVLAKSSFVAVIGPTAGQRSASPLQVRGCSRTFESNVVWELRSRDGSVLASGHTSGGGAEGAAEFRFTVSFTVSAPELGHLEVFEPDESDGEGYPGGRSTIPVILLPNPE